MSTFNQLGVNYQQASQQASEELKNLPKHRILEKLGLFDAADLAMEFMKRYLPDFDKAFEVKKSSDGKNTDFILKDGYKALIPAVYAFVGVRKKALNYLNMYENEALDYQNSQKTLAKDLRAQAEHQARIAERNVDRDARSLEKIKQYKKALDP